MIPPTPEAFSGQLLNYKQSTEVKCKEARVAAVFVIGHLDHIKIQAAHLTSHCILPTLCLQSFSQPMAPESTYVTAALRRSKYRFVLMVQFFHKSYSACLKYTFPTRAYLYKSTKQQSPKQKLSQSIVLSEIGQFLPRKLFVEGSELCPKRCANYILLSICIFIVYLGYFVGNRCLEQRVVQQG